MTNLFRNHTQRMSGAVMLIMSIVLTVLSTLIIMFAANQGRILTKIASNQNISNQAYTAAEAGLEFGINYLLQNSSSILANPVNGYIPAYSNASTQNVSLANGSTFSIAYSNPIQSNYTIILITATGTSIDGSTTRTLSQTMGFAPILANAPTHSVTGLEDVTANGSVTITNTINNQTITSGEGVSLSGSAKTVTSTGTSSTAGNIRNDIVINDPNFSTLSTSNFFASFFGTTSTNTIKNSMAHVYSNNSSTNYSSTLNGMTGTSIWITQTSGAATLNGNTTIGSEANPVLLIVNGEIAISGSVTIYGMVYITGESNISSTINGNVTIVGAVASVEDFRLSGNVNLTYSTTVLNNLRTQSGGGNWTKIPGSWKDF